MNSSLELVVISALTPLISANDQESSAETSNAVSFPSFMLPVSRYYIDTSWPWKLALISWGDIPAVMVDKQDHVRISISFFPQFRYMTVRKKLILPNSLEHQSMTLQRICFLRKSDRMRK